VSTSVYRPRPRIPLGPGHHRAAERLVTGAGRRE